MQGKITKLAKLLDNFFFEYYTKTIESKDACEP